MSKTNYIYLITDNEGVPVCVADNLPRLEELIFEYFGYPQDPKVQFLGYEPFDYCGNYEVYDGVYVFTTEYDLGHTKKECLHRYSLPLNQLNG
jgi:hypothetical protein